jgi:hypothetical protein
MAGTTATITPYVYPSGYDNSQRMQTVRGTVAIGASPATYATGGVLLSWKIEGIKSTSGSPIQVTFGSNTGSGYVYNWIKSTNAIQILTGAAAQSPQTELTNGASIPAAVSGDTIWFEAVFARL